MTQSDHSRGPIRVFVASPIYNDQCYGTYANSLLGLQRALLQAGHDVYFEWTKNVSGIALARNVLANRFLQDTAATHLLFIDADMAFNAADVMKMLECDLDVTAALYPTKVINWNSVAKVARDFPDLPPDYLSSVAGRFGTFATLPGEPRIPIDEPFPVESAGTGIMLIRRNVLLKMSEAFSDISFRIRPQDAAHFPGKTHLFGFFNEITLPDGVRLSEDLSFCERWRSIGGQVHGCAWFKVRHLGTFEYEAEIRALARWNVPL
jgi:hypothetical protein